MKLIIAGSRLSTINKCTVEEALSFFDIKHSTISEVVCGMAKGADTAGKEWAEFYDIRVRLFPAYWRAGKAAGFRRNNMIASYADALLAIWDGKSGGTRHMINRMRQLGKITHIYEI